MSNTEDCVKVAAAIAQIMQDMKDKPEGKLPELKSSARKPSRVRTSQRKPQKPVMNRLIVNQHQSVPKAKTTTRKNKKMMPQKRKSLGILIRLNQ
jgi:cobalamin biosynthesis protein CobT